MDFKKFMGEEKAINRWIVAGIFLTGCLAGVLLATIWNIVALA